MRAKPVTEKEIPPSYEQAFPLSTRVKGGVAAALLALSIIGFAVYMTYPTMTLSSLAVGGGVSALLSGGAAVVIARARPPKVVTVESAENSKMSVYVINGNASFEAKEPEDHFVVSTLVALGAPLVAVGSVGYHALRFCVVPFFVAGCMVKERLTGEERTFALLDIVAEPAKSLKQIVQAPFYGVALTFAALYSFVDPLNGRLLGGAIERDWNDGVPLQRGYWSIIGAQTEWAGFEREKLGGFRFYLAGCWQLVRYEPDADV